MNNSSQLTPSPPPHPTSLSPHPPPLPPRTTSLSPHAPRRPSDDWIAERREKVARAYERQRASLPRGLKRGSLESGDGVGKQDGGGVDAVKELDGAGGKPEERMMTRRGGDGWLSVLWGLWLGRVFDECLVGFLFFLLVWKVGSSAC